MFINSLDVRVEFLSLFLSVFPHRKAKQVARGSQSGWLADVRTNSRFSGWLHCIIFRLTFNLIYADVPCAKCEHANCIMPRALIPHTSQPAKAKASKQKYECGKWKFSLFIAAHFSAV
jgi:hypothetical protein